MTFQQVSLPYGARPTGYRLPDDTRLGTVRLQVSDLERSLDYYRGLLGFTLISRREGEAELGAAGDDAPLVVLVERSGARPVSHPAPLGLYHFAILLPDRASLGRFVKHLAEAGAYAGMSDHLVSEALYLSDPDGLGIEVYADRPRSSWQHRDGQLVMTTQPLNVRAVVAEAGGEEWAGMPAGTVIGHVHLHVGNIDEAAAFYHRALGFDKVVWDYPGALFMSAGGYHHHLGTNTWSRGTPPAEDQARLLSWDLIVPRADDAAAAARSVSQAGYSVTADAPGTWRANDPWGTTIRIISHS
jgi:catechol 2,3-dioxygenase